MVGVGIYLAACHLVIEASKVRCRHFDHDPVMGERKGKGKLKESKGRGSD